MEKIAWALVFLGVCMNASADPVQIETDSFLLSLPSGWEIEELSSQAKLVGPNDEYLVVSSYRISGEGNDQDLEGIRKEFNENIAGTMQQAANEPDLKIVKPLKNEKSDNGSTVWSISTETTDGTAFYSLFGTVGPRVALLLTVEGNMQHKESIETVLNSLNNVQWQ